MMRPQMRTQLPLFLLLCCYTAVALTPAGFVLTAVCTSLRLIDDLLRLRNTSESPVPVVRMFDSV